MTTKRRIVMFNRVSADGYFASKEGDLGWSVPDDQIDQEGAAAIPGFDTVLFGRRTYDQFASFWPHALDDAKTAGDPHAIGRHSPALHAMATMLNTVRKVVFSHTKTPASLTWNNSHVVSEFSPDTVEAMKNQEGKDIIIFGSGSIVSLLTEHRLIDEYQFVVSPVFVGSGKSLVRDNPTARLELLSAKAYPSGNVMLRYAPTHS